MYKSIHLQAGIIHLVLQVLRLWFESLTGSGLLKNGQVGDKYGE